MARVWPLYLGGCMGGGQLEARDEFLQQVDTRLGLILDSVQNSGRAREFWTIIIQNSVDLTVRHCTGYRILSRVQMFWTVRRIRKRILYHVTRILYHITRILYHVTRILSYVQNTGKVYQNSGKVVQNSGKRCPEFLNYPE